MRVIDLMTELAKHDMSSEVLGGQPNIAGTYAIGEVLAPSTGKVVYLRLDWLSPGALNELARGE